MVALSAWYNDILPYASGLTPGNNVDWAIKAAAVEFCERSRAIQTDHTINVVGGTHTYTIPSPAVVQIEAALFMGEDIDPTTVREQTARNVLWRSEAGRVDWYLRPAEQTIRLVRIPSASVTGGLVVTVSTEPDMAAATLDDELYNTHRVVIAEGALSKLLSQQKRPWSDAVRGREREMTFGQLIGRAHVRVFNNRTTARRETRVIGGLD